MESVIYDNNSTGSARKCLKDTDFSKKLFFSYVVHWTGAWLKNTCTEYAIPTNLLTVNELP